MRSPAGGKSSDNFEKTMAVIEKVATIKRTKKLRFPLVIPITVISNTNYMHLADIHRSAETLDLDNIFCFETTRHVNYDFTIMLAGQFIQLLPSPVPLPPPRQVVTVRRWLDGSLHIAWNGQELNYEIFKQRPKPRPRKPNIPGLDHPWRHKTKWTKTTWAKHKRNTKLASKQNNPILPPP